MTLRDTGDELVPAVVDWRVSAWANVNRAGNGNKAHGHPMAYWSGVYWVDDGGIAQDTSLGGELEVSDPRGIIAAMYAPQLRFASRIASMTAVYRGSRPGPG